MKILIDFDGTVVTHEYPAIGEELQYCADTLIELVEQGHKLILWTMRSGHALKEAIEWFAGHNIELYGVQKDPTQHTWTASPKAHGNLSIDDRNLGVPLSVVKGQHRPSVDWLGVRNLLIKQGILRDNGENVL